MPEKTTVTMTVTLPKPTAEYVRQEAGRLYGAHKGSLQTLWLAMIEKWKEEESLSFRAKTEESEK